MTMKGGRLCLWLAPVALLLSACSSAPGPSSSPEDAPSSDSLSGPVVEQRWDLLLVGTNERLSMPETPF